MERKALCEVRLSDRVVKECQTTQKRQALLRKTSPTWTGWRLASFTAALPLTKNMRHPSRVLAWSLDRAREGQRRGSRYSDNSLLFQPGYILCRYVRSDGWQAERRRTPLPGSSILTPSSNGSGNDCPSNPDREPITPAVGPSIREREAWSEVRQQQ